MKKTLVVIFTVICALALMVALVSCNFSGSTGPDNGNSGSGNSGSGGGGGGSSTQETHIYPTSMNDLVRMLRGYMGGETAVSIGTTEYFNYSILDMEEYGLVLYSSHEIGTNTEIFQITSFSYYLEEGYGTIITLSDSICRSISFRCRVNFDSLEAYVSEYFDEINPTTGLRGTIDDDIECFMTFLDDYLYERYKGTSNESYFNEYIDYFNYTYFVGEDWKYKERVRRGDTPNGYTPSVSNKIFEGWYEDSNFYKKHDWSTPSKVNVNLYAKFIDADVYVGDWILSNCKNNDYLVGNENISGFDFRIYAAERNGKPYIIVNGAGAFVGYVDLKAKRFTIRTATPYAECVYTYTISGSNLNIGSSPVSSDGDKEGIATLKQTLIINVMATAGFNKGLTKMTDKAKAGGLNSSGFSSVSKQYFVFYSFEDGFTGNGLVTSVNSGDTLDLSSKNVSKDGYEFKGWYLSSSFSGSPVTGLNNISSDKHVYALIHPQNYTITYNLGGGTNADGNPSSYNIETPEITLLSPSKEHYDFVCWKKNGSAVTKITKGATGNIELTAQWKAKEYPVTYILNGGSASNPSKYTYESSEITLTNPLKAGSVFLGWSGTDVTGLINQVKIPTGSSGARTYTANWADISITSNNKKAGTLTALKNTYNPGEEITIEVIKTNNGYEWTGWFENGVLVTKDTSYTFTAGEENVTYRGEWEPVTYRITYSLEGGINAKTNPSTYTVESQTITFDNPSRAYYDFVAWYNGDKLTQKIPAGSYGDITVKAEWTPSVYSITCNLGGGAAVNPESYTYETDDITLNNPSRSGYTFSGWSEPGSDVKNTTVVITKGSSGDKTYNANWIPVTYTITYNGCEGADNTENPVSYTIETATFTLKTPVKTGYDFNGWYLEESFSTKKTSVNKGSIGNIELFAKFSPIKYAISYQLDGGINSDQNPLTFTIENEIILSNPTKSNSLETRLLLNGNIFGEITKYVFDGWYAEEKFETPVSVVSGCGDRNVYAKWVETTEVEEATYLRANDEIYFGGYPQTRVTDATIVSNLNVSVGELPSSSDNHSWTSYGYYIKSSNTVDYMWYVDKEYDGKKYRGVYFISYRPQRTESYPGTESYSYQDDNGYNTSTVYWFKYEPIKWRILSELNGQALILCDMIIDSQPYQNTSDYASWEYATIRSWLNDNFYNTAFNDLQKSLIIQQTLSTARKGGTDTTIDKVFLLNKTDIENSSYGLNLIKSRQKKITAYAQCQGGITTNNESYNENGRWWLRSPYTERDDYSSYIVEGGNIEYWTVKLTYIGVVPALKIKL